MLFELGLVRAEMFFRDGQVEVDPAVLGVGEVVSHATVPDVATQVAKHRLDAPN